ncbi:branched-chain amino acid ABC transporter substrate-binding protein [Pollutimonas harenae]|uniref:Branched-chain amino acid ABC transporter substrate-binding protein n=1 Tax=Pollutimonas harenae TaxID=657015 RepID=A0A853GV96_9BURK|nr:branched-chain amino acid ABC transporter substrate-binding protein [Pollutimonas harenae]NYT84706.1 branched-chain amino acid ABC transporter substrate-binding protein [Pollutimonas harenae]TEA72891.1 branched-chain amino acid ABC transporter substrate-binding protein [Pollutimonas harenae]
MNFTKLAVALSACGMVAMASAQAAPLKIALVETLSGAQASTGLMYRTAANYGLQQLNEAGGWNGEAIQIAEYDNQGGPAGASDKVKAAIADGARIIIQGSSSAVSGQITEDVRKYNIRNPGKEVLFLNMGGEALELTGDKCHFYHFRFTTNAPIRVKALVKAMKEAGDLGTKVYSMNQNYSWGNDMQTSIQDFAKEGGYEVVESTLHDVNRIQDFSPYASKIKASGAQTVITGNWSNDLLLLMKATRGAGLDVRFGTVFLDQPGNLANAGETALGHYIANAYNMSASPEAEKFGEEYKAETGHYPTYIEPQTVFGIRMLAEALKATPPEDGQLNMAKLALNLEKVKLTTPVGETSIRAEDHQVILPIVVSKVTKEAKYKADETAMGFEVVTQFAGPDAVNPLQKTCKMKRPA